MDYAAAAAITPNRRMVSTAIVRIANSVPKQPHLRSPAGSLSNRSVTISPISGVLMAEIRNAQPKPIFLRAPSKPTRTETKEKEITPNIKSKASISDYIDIIDFSFAAVTLYLGHDLLTGVLVHLDAKIYQQNETYASKHRFY